jgi:hypothetical protein
MNHNLINATANPTTAITGASSSCSATFTPSANVPSAFVTVGSDTFSNAAGKLNQIKLWAQALLFAGACAGQAQAFTNSIAPFDNITQLGSCRVHEFRDLDRISVFIFANPSDPDPIAFAGSNQWSSAAIDTRFQGPVDSAKVASCLGLAAADVVITHQDGADGTFATDTYVGFTFTTSVNSAYPAYPAGTYEFSVEEASANVAPTANAGPDQTVASATAPVTLNGTGSSDPDAGQTLTYAWTAPAGITLSNATAASPTFTAPTLAVGAANQTLTFSLIVTDNLGLASTADTVTITVVPPIPNPPSPAPTPVPTMSEWAMIFMATLMALFGIRRMRRQ